MIEYTCDSCGLRVGDHDPRTMAYPLGWHMVNVPVSPCGDLRFIETLICDACYQQPLEDFGYRAKLIEELTSA